MKESITILAMLVTGALLSLHFFGAQMNPSLFGFIVGVLFGRVM